MNESPKSASQGPWGVEERRDATARRPSSRHMLKLIIGTTFLVIAVLVGIAGYLEKWLWMRQLDYTGIFWTLLSVQSVMFCSAFVLAFLYLWINLRMAARNSGAVSESGQSWRSIFPFGADATRSEVLRCNIRFTEESGVAMSELRPGI